MDLTTDTLATLVVDGDALCARLIVKGEAADARLVGTLTRSLDALLRENQELANSLTHAEDQLAALQERT